MRNGLQIVAGVVAALAMVGTAAAGRAGQAGGQGRAGGGGAAPVMKSPVMVGFAQVSIDGTAGAPGILATASNPS